MHQSSDSSRSWLAIANLGREDDERLRVDRPVVVTAANDAANAELAPQAPRQLKRKVI